MTGTIINVAAIMLAGLLGLLLHRGIPEGVSRAIQDALGILVIIIGIQYAFKADNYAIIGLSLALGTVAGEWRRWEDRLELLGDYLQKRFTRGNNDSQFVRGFVSASLLFCVGAMGVVGALEDGLTGNYQILLIKSMLDGIFSLIFSASMGVGVIFSAFPVLLYQGLISLAAGALKPLLTGPILNDITAVGGVLIAGLGINLLGLKRIKVGNLLPAIIIVPFMVILFRLIGQ